MDLTDFLFTRLTEVRAGDPRIPLAGSIATILAAYRSVDAPVGPHQAAAYNALGFALQALAAAWSDHPDYDRAWALR